MSIWRGWCTSSGNSPVSTVSVQLCIMMHASGRVLRKRFLTKEEKLAYQRLQEKKKQEERLRALRESKVRKAKAKKERELKKKRAELKMKTSLQACEPGFRSLVEQWAKGKTTANVNKFFRLLEEVKCPVERSYNPSELEPSAKALRMNKCGYKKFFWNLSLPDNVLGCEFWTKKHQKSYENAHELDGILQGIVKRVSVRGKWCTLGQGYV